MTRPASVTRVAVLAAIAALGACKTEKAPPHDTTHAAAATSRATNTTAADSGARRLGVLGQMKTPESVKYDADLDAYFISNINGNPNAHDGNGYIVRVPA